MNENLHSNRQDQGSAEEINQKIDFIVWLYR
jgi:hypothetical protein